MENESTVLQFAHVTGKKKKFYLNDISFAMQPGYIYGMVGENGAGKTTLMRYILEEKNRYDGKIFVNGVDIADHHAMLMNRIGYVSEDNEFFDACSGTENAKTLGLLYDDFQMELFRESAAAMQLSTAKIYGKMSRGERLKFQLAFAIAHRPSLYLLDEVTAGMDAVFRLELFELLRKLIRDETCSILLTSHITSEIERETDYVAVMEHGTLSPWMESIDFMEKWRAGKAGAGA